MTKHIRRRVLRFETRPNDGPEDSRRLFPEIGTAVLECGHRLNLGVESERSRYRPKRMACWECGRLPKKTRQTDKTGNVQFSDVKDVLTGALFAAVLTVPLVLWLTKAPPGIHPTTETAPEIPKLYQYMDVIAPDEPIQSVAPEPQTRAHEYTQILEFLGLPEPPTATKLNSLRINAGIPNLGEVWPETRDAVIRWTPDEATLAAYLHVEIPEAKRPLHARRIAAGRPSPARSDPQKTPRP